jgi:hypothetical protein
MKKSLVVVVLAIGLCASVANAQLPNVGVYFDNTFTEMSGVCPTDPAGTVYQQLYVVANNFNMWMAAIEYMIVFPPSMTWDTDIIGSNQLKIGFSPTGIGITWPMPANAFGTLLVQKVLILWECQNTGTIEEPDCGTATDNLITVVAHPSFGKLRALQWPDNAETLGTGLTSVICGQTIPVEETTWGGIKALY